VGRIPRRDKQDFVEPESGGSFTGDREMGGVNRIESAAKYR
jgi:hypothetical protein